jgi:eukaryotic-like serine/threonine-protein kinase
MLPFTDITRTSSVSDIDEQLGLSQRPEDPDREMLERELRGQYQIVRLLGRGGMGAVYLARDIALHRVVAIKTLRWDLFSNVDERERFKREARMSAQLNHPNVVPVLTFGETPNVMYIVMRYVHGESLATRMRRQGRIAGAEVRAVLAELTLALDYAHRHGTVHRDLKPENILLESETERPMLADFGVAMRRWQDPLPGEPRQSFGTPHFMSPEQAAGDPGVDGRSDIYALGVVGYLMLSGVLPFDGRDYYDVASRRPTVRHIPLHRLAPDAPIDLVDAIERCLAYEAGRRWRTARELHDALIGTGDTKSKTRWRLRRIGIAFVRWIRELAHVPTRPSGSMLARAER